MRIVYSPLANQRKENILQLYTGINLYFDDLEKNIQQSPYEATEERIVIEGKVVIAYKRGVKTGLFSGNFKTSFLHLSLSYFVNEPNQLIVIIGAYIHYYTN